MPRSCQSALVVARQGAQHGAELQENDSAAARRSLPPMPRTERLLTRCSVALVAPRAPWGLLHRLSHKPLQRSAWDRTDAVGPTDHSTSASVGGVPAKSAAGRSGLAAQAVSEVGR